LSDESLFVLGPFVGVLPVQNRASEQIGEGVAHIFCVCPLACFHLRSFQNRRLHVVRDFAILNHLIGARMGFRDG
jgi:hypothetical protein